MTWQTLIDEFLDHDFSISQVGAIGTSLNLAGMIGGESSHHESSVATQTLQQPRRAQV